MVKDATRSQTTEKFERILQKLKHFWLRMVEQTAIGLDSADSRGIESSSTKHFSQGRVSVLNLSQPMLSPTCWPKAKEPCPKWWDERLTPSPEKESLALQRCRIYGWTSFSSPRYRTMSFFYAICSQTIKPTFWCHNNNSSNHPGQQNIQ